MNLPTEEQSLDYFEKFKVPLNIRNHCLKVREVAVFLAKRLQEKGVAVNVKFVGCLALLHDLFKIVSLKNLKPNKFHDYRHSAEETAMWKFLKAKFPGMYEGEVAYLIFKDDYPELALSLKTISNPRTEKNPEEEIVHYADWRILQNKVVNLSKRLDYLKEIYPRDAKLWEKDVKIMFTFEDRLFSQIGFKADELGKKMEEEKQGEISQNA